MIVVDVVLQALGGALAIVYMGYALFFLVFGFIVFHELVLLYLVASMWKSSVLGRRLPLLLIEVLYGLVNPLIYLLVLQYSPLVKPDPMLSVVAWILLVTIWGSRLGLGVGPVRRSRATRISVALLAALAFACLLGFIVKDISFQTAGWSLLEEHGWLVPGLLYIIPGVLLVRHAWVMRSAVAWDGGRGFFLSMPRGAWAILILVLATVTVTAHRPSTAQVEWLVLHHRDNIVAAGKSQEIDPALIASIVYVTHRELTTALADRLERLTMGAWLADRTNNFFLGERFDASVGIAQIKPLTAMTVLVTMAASPLPGRLFKEYRGVPALGNRWRLAPGVIRVTGSPFQEPLPKREVVQALFDDRRNIEMCALILALYAAQWEAANPAWSIRHRPEILATLYQIGFERSWPKPDPRPNRFGERVGEVYRSPFIQRTFGSAAA